MIAAVLVGLSIFASVMFPLPPIGPSRSRRSLLGRWDSKPGINPILRSRIKPLDVGRDTEKESGTILIFFIFSAADFSSAG